MSARWTLLAMIVAAGLASIVGSGGGGGGGGGGTEEAPPSTVLSYILGAGQAGDEELTVSAMSGALTIVFPRGSLSRDVPWLEGTYDTATDDYTLSSSPDPVAWVNTTGVPFGQLEVRVTQTFHWNDANDPTTGEMTVTSRDQPSSTFTGTIKIAVTSSPAPGVNISQDTNNDGTPEFGPTFYNWITFEDLWQNTGADLWQRVTSFAYSMRGFLYDQADLAIEGFAVIGDLTSAFEAAGPGSTFPAACSPIRPCRHGQTRRR
jgi:hypothetical protein